MICVFDIETVPDVELLENRFGDEFWPDSPIEICKQAFDKQEKATGSTFLPIPFHKIISIAGVFCDNYGNFEKVGVFGRRNGYPSDDKIEEVTIGEFLKWFNKYNPKLVSFNGRGFDLPALMLRAMKYNLESISFFEQENSKFNKTKWDNYRQRYSENFHIDLLDSLTHYGSARGLKLDDVSSLYGFPGKYGIRGEDVCRTYYEQQNIGVIDNYCESDVLNTYWIYLKYEILKGNLSLKDYIEILEKWNDRMPKDKDYTNIFLESIQKEIQKSLNMIN